MSAQVFVLKQSSSSNVTYITAYPALNLNKTFSASMLVFHHWTYSWSITKLRATATVKIQLYVFSRSADFLYPQSKVIFCHSQHPLFCNLLLKRPNLFLIWSLERMKERKNPVYLAIFKHIILYTKKKKQI